ncbi:MULTISPECIES: chorismate-binding protein [Tenacibaculum]|uniref:chorismate-binding protein n=1 Tax=Tenacibaculum TaxID=104267 RepID=UPI001F0A9A69|nr:MULTISPECIES: chorismate-binding protein [Tenacibaculum]MCH3883240.1 chorismate-binding protein [Tenacibaculum aquimarinum]MDO6600916.1 chorismate-binding protein [Tenacibaculum sp. 1_MG-2023]
MNSIFKNIEAQFKKQLPFVAYKKPNETFISAYLQETDKLFFADKLTEYGFVFAPFEGKEKAILIPEKYSEFITEEFVINEELTFKNHFSDDFSSKENHIELVEKAISAINNNEFKKVVVSRKELVQLVDFDLITVFDKLLNLYTNAMVYVWFHPKVGLWFGATPETLLKVKGNEFETMSLAGTQTYNGTINVTWQQKEIEEQQFVTDYIVGNLKATVKNISASKTETIKAGNLLHLKTKISGEFKTNSLELISKLHPTPAVCGLPLDMSRDFILENENYKRSFYTGFLGEININSNFYVNLRCMEIVGENAHIYVGGGITKNSNPLKEWEETVAKTRVMKKVL